MRLKRYAAPLTVVALLLCLVPTIVLAGTRAQDGQNLLVNPGFEGGWHWQGDSYLGKVADGWVAWWMDEASGKTPDDVDYWKNQRPEYGLIGLEYYIPDQIHGGRQALQYGKRYATHTAGVYQQVSGIEPGAHLKFVAWGFVFGKDPDPSRTPGYVHMKIGIDPTGGTNVFAGSVVWSGEANPVAIGGGSNWHAFAVEAQAQNSTVTVFTYSSPDWPMDDALTSQWDDASLVITAPGEAPTGTAPPPPPTSTPGPPPPPPATSTPRPDGSVVHKVQSGDTLWSIAIQYANGSNISPEQMLVQINELNNNPQLIYPGQELVIAVPGSASGVAAVPATQGEASPTPAAAAEGSQQPTDGAQGGGGEQQVAAQAPAQASMSGSSAICVAAYHDRNGDGARDPSTEELLPESGFTLSNENGVVGSHSSDGEKEPYCFERLVPGTYMVRFNRPAGYASTTPEYWAVALVEGTTTNVQFGNQVDPSAPASSGTLPESAASIEQSESVEGLLEPADAAETGNQSQSQSSGESKSLLSRLGEIAIGVSGIFVLLLAIAVGTAFVASRRQTA
jgi:LysM repeat protein